MGRGRRCLRGCCPKEAVLDQHLIREAKLKMCTSVLQFCLFVCFKLNLLWGSIKLQVTIFSDVHSRVLSTICTFWGTVGQ